MRADPCVASQVPRRGGRRSRPRRPGRPDRVPTGNEEREFVANEIRDRADSPGAAPDGPAARRALPGPSTRVRLPGPAARALTGARPEGPSRCRTSARARDVDASPDPASRREPSRDALRRGDALAGPGGGLRDGLSGGRAVGQPRPEAGARPPMLRAGLDRPGSGDPRPGGPSGPGPGGGRAQRDPPARPARALDGQPDAVRPGGESGRPEPLDVDPGATATSLRPGPRSATGPGGSWRSGPDPRGGLARRISGSDRPRPGELGRPPLAVAGVADLAALEDDQLAEPEGVPAGRAQRAGRDHEAVVDRLAVEVDREGRRRRSGGAGRRGRGPCGSSGPSSR